jgi:hypothetical protein
MARRPDNQIVGVCRFSYPATGGFKLSDKGQDAVIDALYAPERLRRRFAYFEKICLPSLAAQTDPDFTFVVLMGDAMPIKWRRRLKSLRAEYPVPRDLRGRTARPASGHAPRLPGRCGGRRALRHRLSARRR